MGEGSVSDVREALTKDRNLAYTTVLTLLDRLAKRGVATRRKLGRRFIYAPKVSRETLRKLAVKDLVDDFFDGSRQSLLKYLRATAAPPPSRPAPRQSPATR